MASLDVCDYSALCEGVPDLTFVVLGSFVDIGIRAKIYCG